MERRHFLKATATLAVACKKAGPPDFPVPEVEVVTAHAESVPLTRDLVGRLSATRAADVRARVAGVADVDQRTERFNLALRLNLTLTG